MRKKILSIFVCMLLLVTFLSVTGDELTRKNIPMSSTKVKNIKNLDMQDSHFVSKLDKKSFISEPLPIWTLRFFFDLEFWSGENGNVGAEFAYDALNDKYYFYSTRWATNWLHKYEYDFSSPSILNCVPFQVDDGSGGFVYGLRDLAYDGTYFYGGHGSNTIYKMDFMDPNPHLVSTITDTTNTIHVRAIAYDPTLDGGNGGFYVSDWADPVWIVSRSGDILGSFNLYTTTSTYGFAYDDACGGRFLWVFDQGSGAGHPQYIYQWDLISGGFTTVTYNVINDFPTTQGIAGGLFFTTDMFPSYAILGGLLQGTPDYMFCYEICSSNYPPNPPTLVSPTHGTLMVDACNPPILTWLGSTDPESDPITYEVYLDDGLGSPTTPGTFTQITTVPAPTTSCNLATIPGVELICGRTYWWDISANDGINPAVPSSNGPWCFTTRTGCLVINSIDVAGIGGNKVEVKIENTCSVWVNHVKVEMKFNINPNGPCSHGSGSLTLSDEFPISGTISASGDTVTWTDIVFFNGMFPIRTFSVKVEGCACFDVTVTVNSCADTHSPPNPCISQDTRNGCVCKLSLW